MLGERAERLKTWRISRDHNIARSTKILRRVLEN